MLSDNAVALGTSDRPKSRVGDSAEANQLKVGFEFVEVEFDSERGQCMTTGILGVFVRDLDATQITPKEAISVLGHININDAPRSFKAGVCKALWERRNFRWTEVHIDAIATIGFIELAPTPATRQKQ